jgi:hypothetical protein
MRFTYNPFLSHSSGQLLFHVECTSCGTGFIFKHPITSVSTAPNIATFPNRPSLNVRSDPQSDLTLIEVETMFLEQEVKVKLPSY